MAYGSSYEERVAAIPGQTYAPPREVMPSTEDILARGSDAALQAGRTTYEPQFGPKGAVSGSPSYTGKKDVPQQYYGSEADIMQSDVIRNTKEAPFATRAAVQNARLQEGRKLNLEYGDDAYGKTSITGTSSLPSGKVNVFSGSSAPLTETQRANEAARVAEGQRVADMYSRQAAAIPGRAAEQAPVGFNPETDVIGSASTPWGALLSAGIKGKQSRLAREEAGRTERTAMGEEGATRRAAIAAKQRAGEVAGTQAIEREKMGVGSEESRARAGLLGEQAGLAATQRGKAEQYNKLLSIVGDTSKSPEERRNAETYLNRYFGGAAEKDPREFALKEVEAMVRTPEEYKSKYGFANGGVIERYNGENGSLVRPRYFDKESLWGKLETGAKGALGMGAKEPAPAPKQAIATAPETDPSKGMWTLTPEEEAALPPYGRPTERYSGKYGSLVQPGNGLMPDLDWYTLYAKQAGELALPFEQAMAIKRGSNVQQPVARFADGGDVSALNRPIRGPGTGTSDSIPAVVNGERPAALSDGEFVIPAHVVKAKGTEFFEKLIAQYADKGEENVG